MVVPFFTTTWEHYFTDRMILPIVNGPSEGVLLGIVAACLRGYYGVEFFDEPRESLGGATYGMALIGFSLSGVVLTMLIQLVAVWKRRMEMGRSMVMPLWNCVGFALLLGASGFWAHSRPDLFMEIPYTMLLLLCVLHVDICVHIMVCHVSFIRCRPIRPLLLPFLLVVGNSFLPSGPLVKETSIVWGLTAVSFVYEGLYLYTAVREISMALGIQVFSLGKANEGNSKTS